MLQELSEVRGQVLEQPRHGVVGDEGEVGEGQVPLYERQAAAVRLGALQELLVVLFFGQGLLVLLLLASEKETGVP